jgi:hypothetical protein
MEHRDHRSGKIQHLELKKSVHLMVEKDFMVEQLPMKGI